LAPCAGVAVSSRGCAVTDLAKDVAAVLAPVQALGQRLSVAEKFVIDAACDDVIRICEDEEKEVDRLCDLVQELEQKLDDSGVPD